MVIKWQSISISSPHLSKPVEVVAAKTIPYVEGGHKFQTFNIYTRKIDSTTKLIDQAATTLPNIGTNSGRPRIHVHIHGGAWRDPFLTAESVEPLAACAFSANTTPIDTVVGINYTLSPFPTHPSAPYDPTKGDTGQPWREARHPDHIQDALMAFKTLRSFGLTDDQFLLSGHSCGACIAFQSILQDPKHWALKEQLPPPPRPYALVGLNGLYDLVALVNGLGPSHQSMSEDYERFQSIAFGTDQLKWQLYSPARFDANAISSRIEKGHAPKRILLDQSTEDQLVPFNQLQRMRIQLEQVAGLHILQGTRCVGKHAAPWEQGYMIWDTILDILEAYE
jgi:kynurenine formamidase